MWFEVVKYSGVYITLCPHAVLAAKTHYTTVCTYLCTRRR